jgi:hypothetical protein
MSTQQASLELMRLINDEPPIVLTNEERREQMRELVRRAFTQVIQHHPELAGEEAISEWPRSNRDQWPT